MILKFEVLEIYPYTLAVLETLSILHEYYKVLTYLLLIDDLLLLKLELYLYLSLHLIFELWDNC
jgi:hypothetical protein